MNFSLIKKIAPKNPKGLRSPLGFDIMNYRKFKQFLNHLEQ